MIFTDITLLINLSASILFLKLNYFDFITFNGLFLTSFQFIANLTFLFACKFLIAIAFLILIRGGAPRYRYDYLTKLGWLKFLSFIIAIFLLSLFFIFAQ